MGLKVRRIIIIVSFIVLIILGVFLVKIHEIFSVICAVAICLVNRILWSCPNCGMYLGKSLSLEDNKYCRHCGDALNKYF